MTRLAGQKHRENTRRQKSGEYHGFRYPGTVDYRRLLRYRDSHLEYARQGARRRGGGENVPARRRTGAHRGQGIRVDGARLLECAGPYFPARDANITIWKGFGDAASRPQRAAWFKARLEYGQRRRIILTTISALKSGRTAGRQAACSTRSGSDLPYCALSEFPILPGKGCMSAIRDVRRSTPSRVKSASGLQCAVSMGWDAFGLPTENYAIKNHVHRKPSPKKTSNVSKRSCSRWVFPPTGREINIRTPLLQVDAVDFPEVL